MLPYGSRKGVHNGGGGMAVGAGAEGRERTVGHTSHLKQWDVTDEASKSSQGPSENQEHRQFSANGSDPCRPEAGL